LAAYSGKNLLYFIIFTKINFQKNQIPKMYEKSTNKYLVELIVFLVYIHNGLIKDFFPYLFTVTLLQSNFETQCGILILFIFIHLESKTINYRFKISDKKFTMLTFLIYFVFILAVILKFSLSLYLLNYLTSWSLLYVLNILILLDSSLTVVIFPLLIIIKRYEALFSYYKTLSLILGKEPRRE